MIHHNNFHFDSSVPDYTPRPVNTFRLRLRLRCITWLAIFAMAGLALLPSLSHAMSDRTDWTQVCTPEGMKLVASSDMSGDDAGSAPVSLSVHLEHCPFCAQGGATLGMPPAAMQAVAPTAVRAEMPPLFLQAPRTLFAWAAAQPRGPPARD